MIYSGLHIISSSIIITVHPSNVMKHFWSTEGNIKTRPTRHGLSYLGDEGPFSLYSLLVKAYLSISLRPLGQNPSRGLPIMISLVALLLFLATIANAINPDNVERCSQLSPSILYLRKQSESKFSVTHPIKHYVVDTRVFVLAHAETEEGGHLSVCSQP